MIGGLRVGHTSNEAERNNECCTENIYKNSAGEWVYGVEVTVEWFDEDSGYGDEDTYYEEHDINFCPYCGRNLRGENKFEN